MKNTLACVQELDGDVERYSISRRKTEVGFSFPLHWHRHFECEILLDGSGKHIFNGSSYEVKKGDFWLLSSYDFHTYRPSEETEMLHICFERGLLSRELEELISTGGICGRMEECEMGEIAVLGEALLREEIQRDHLSDLSVSTLISRLLIILLRHTKLESTAHTTGVGSALAYMHKHFRKELSLEQVAQQQGFSANYFGTLFRSAIGVTFREYLNKIRLRYACDLLASSALSIKEIAYESGYASIEYFTYVFKKRLSMTPAEYRRRISAS